MTRIPFLLGASLVGFDLVHADLVFQERKGLVVMEAESTGSRLGDWDRKTDVAGYEGECHLEFTGNTITNGPPESPLEYEFTVRTEGLYTLMLRARKRLETDRDDLSNDCYVSMDGDFDAGGDAPLEVLERETKMFGGKPDGWGWAVMLDVNHKKFAPVYRFKAGETYTLTIHGRSKNFNVDRIVLFHESVGRRDAQKPGLAESRRLGRGEEVAPPPRVTRTLTDQQGRQVRAELVAVEGAEVVAIIAGRRHRIPAETLAEEDQLFISRWWAGEE